MGKVNTITLNPDMTFEEKKRKTQSKQIVIDKDYSVTLTPGRSVFSEVGLSRWKPWKKPRNLVIHLDRAQKAFELHDGATRELDPNYWTQEEEKKFVKKIIAKSKAEQKVISLSYFLILTIMMIIIIILQIAAMKGIRIV